MLSILEGASTSTTIGQKVVTRLFGPATLFWGGGIVASISFYGWSYLSNYLYIYDSYQVVALALGGFSLLYISDVVMEWSSLLLLSLIEGASWPVPLRISIVFRLRKKLAEKKQRLDQLINLDLTHLPVAERLTKRKEQLQLDAELASYPVNWDHLMPTSIGNRLRAAEEHSYTRYGLEAITVWPHLWLVLPQETKQELSAARQPLIQATQLFGWGLLFWLWIYFAWWAAPIALLIVTLAYWRMIHTAGTYADFIRAAFDLHRFDLYKQMNWPAPENSDTEKEEGRRLTQYIWRGYLNQPVTFALKSDYMSKNKNIVKQATNNHSHTISPRPPKEACRSPHPPTAGASPSGRGGEDGRKPPERFQLVDPIPYLVGPPIIPESGSLFVGRQELIDWIEDRLQEQQKPLLVLYGQRRIGKTSLLLQVARGARGRHLREGSSRLVYPVYIDLQGLTDLGTDLFLFEIASSIATTVQKRDMMRPLPDETEFYRAPYRAFNQFLDTVESQVEQGLLLIIFDEFEQLEERVANGKVDIDIFNYFRSQMQHRHSIAFLLAGTHRLEEMSRDYQSIIFNLVRHREVTFLERSEGEELIRKAVYPWVSYDHEAVVRIWRATGGHPYFTQLLCWQIINDMNKRARSNHISQEHVEQAIKRIIERGGQELNYLWDQSPLIERALLVAMAELADGANGTSSELVEQLSPAILPKADVTKTLERLVARRVLKHSPSKPASAAPLDAPASYSYTFDLMRQWVSDKQPLSIVWQQLKEG